MLKEMKEYLNKWNNIHNHGLENLILRWRATQIPLCEISKCNYFLEMDKLTLNSYRNEEIPNSSIDIESEE
jgi:hypothetical protein